MLILALLFILIALLAVAGSISGQFDRSLGLNFFRRPLRPGVPIVYRVQETSTRPSPDAVDVFPSEHGESYDYLANRYWRVEEVLPDGWIVARTPLMEHQYLRRNDPNLRKASLLERLRHAARFPTEACR